MTVPKRRPPKPHSWSRSRSPRRQRAAAKPSQVMKRKSATKTTSATQFTSCMGSLLGGEIDGGGEDGADDDPEELVPIKEGHADEARLRLVVEGRPQHGHELDDEEQVPPAPPAPPVLVL